MRRNARGTAGTISLASLVAWCLAAAALLFPAPGAVVALRCYASVLSTKGELQTVRNYQCDDGAAACGAYTRRCTNSTPTLCSTDQVLRQANTTVYSCFWNLSACQDVGKLANYSVVSCCGAANCNEPGNSAAGPPRAHLVLASFLAAAVFLFLLSTS